MLKGLGSYLILPREISSFERSYLARMNRIALIFFYCHLPVFMAVAALCQTNVALAAGLTVITLIGPTLAYRFFENPRAVSVTFGITAMGMGGLLVHFGQGPMQIEMHFYFFTLLALLSIFGNPLVIVVAAVTVAAHHGLLFFLLPKSVFNYDASIWAVAVHALFVVLESVAACFMARSFFNNVIGLERIVGQRTRELDAVNQDMRLVLDNVGEGFFTIGRNGIMSQERSRVVAKWLGGSEPQMKFSDYVGRVAPEFGSWFAVAWEEVLEDTLLLEMAIDQLPKRLQLGETAFALRYRPIMQNETLERLLIVMSDITSDVARERFEIEQREMLNILERITQDRSGFLEFAEEGSEIVTRIMNEDGMSLATMKRLIHTLKGNSGLFGVGTITSLCHELENSMAERDGRLDETERALLGDRWHEYQAKLAMFSGERTSAKVEIESSEHEACLSALLQGAPRQEVARMVNDWRLEPMARRLERIAEQARGIAKRLDKGDIEIEVVHNNQRVLAKPWAPFWSAFAHVVRNAIDHGIEPPAERARLGKPAVGRLKLGTFCKGDRFVVEIADDGRGIDWAVLGERARAAGLAADTHEHLIEALFQDGITTQVAVSEFSGRGVGLGAVRAACRALGGDVAVWSAAGKGTKLTFTVPLESTGREIGASHLTNTKRKYVEPTAPI